MTRHDDARSPSTNPRPITREQIAALAHAIWQDRGCPQGSDLDIWLEAERQLKGKVTRRTVADDIPADPASAGDPDADPALRPSLARQLEDLPPRGDPNRSPTSL
jgi:hypothetical protein